MEKRAVQKLYDLLRIIRNPSLARYKCCSFLRLEIVVLQQGHIPDIHILCDINTTYKGQRHLILLIS